VGLVEQALLLDLCYEEDVAADVDMNIVMTGSGQFVEVQGTAEGEPFEQHTLTQLIDLARNGIVQLVREQETILASFSD
jgi:ribonuclease PH